MKVAIGTLLALLASAVMAEELVCDMYGAVGTEYSDGTLVFGDPEMVVGNSEKFRIELNDQPRLGSYVNNAWDWIDLVSARPERAIFQKDANVLHWSSDPLGGKPRV